MKKLKSAIVVDDDPDVRKMLKHILENLGYETETYHDPLKCPLYDERVTECRLETACRDVLITDYSMPGMNGVDFIRLQRRKNCKISKMAIMSGAWNDDIKRIAGKLNCRLFDKPFSMAELETWLQS